jgi:hypothetical protein
VHRPHLLIDDLVFIELNLQRDALEQQSYDTFMAALSENLSEDEIARLAVEGATWTEEKAVAEALKSLTTFVQNRETRE